MSNTISERDWWALDAGLDKGSLHTTQGTRTAATLRAAGLREAESHLLALIDREIAAAVDEARGTESLWFALYHKLGDAQMASAAEEAVMPFMAASSAVVGETRGDETSATNVEGLPQLCPSCSGTGRRSENEQCDDCCGTGGPDAESSGPSKDGYQAGDEEKD